MIVTTIEGQLLLVRQIDHQVLAGQLAEAWGNTHFSRPEPFAPLVRAAFEHDNGWKAWEEVPTVDPATLRPYQFTDLPVEDHLAFYRQGIDELAARDAHAGLLVNLHCQGFHNQRFGTLPAMVMKPHPPEQEQAVKRFTVALQSQERNLGRRVAIDLSTLWAQYELLQVFDRLSLYLCMPPVKPAELGPVPVGSDGVMVTLRLTPQGDDVVTVDPWPLRESMLSAHLPAHRVPNRSYSDDNEFRRQFERADSETIKYTLQPV